jgi:hypothetical protein
VGFVADSITIAEIQYKKSVFNTFSKNTIKNFMVDTVKERYKNNPSKIRSEMIRMHQNFLRSTAGY